MFAINVKICHFVYIFSLHISAVAGVIGEL